MSDPNVPQPTNPLTALLAGIQTQQSTLPSNVESVGIDDASITSREFQVFKVGEKGEIARLTVLMPSAIKVARTHYIPKKGYFLCMSQYVRESGYDRKVKEEICCQLTKEEPRRRCGALVIHWGTNKSGQVQRIQVPAGQFPVAFEFKLWRFGEGMFDQLRQVNGEFPLMYNDILLTSEDPAYQRATVRPTQGSLAATTEFITAAGPQLKAWLESKSSKIAAELGSAKTHQQWMELTGGGLMPAGNTAAATADTPPQSIVDLLSNT